MFYCKLSTSCQQVNQAYREKVIQFEVKRARHNSEQLREFLVTSAIR